MTATPPNESELAIQLVREHEPCVLVLRGELSLHTASSLARALAKVLLNHGQVMVDLADLRLRWTPTLQVFPTALAAAGGWPFARLVLFGADEQLAAALHGARVPTRVPLASTPRAARERLNRRPTLVLRHHDLANDLAAPRRARVLARRACTDWGIGGTAEESVLVASELVTNVVQHAHTRSRLALALDDRGLQVSVRDARPGQLPRLRPLTTGAAGGHGLHLVAAVSRRWGVTPCPGGKRVWALLPIEGHTELNGTD